FFSQNAVVMVTSGQQNPNAYRLSGKVLQAQGGGLFLDEFPRYPIELQELFLHVVENREVSRGAVTVPLDAMIFLAGNDESMVRLAEKGALALVDRMTINPMRLSTFPYEVGKTLLLENQKS